MAGKTVYLEAQRKAAGASPFPEVQLTGKLHRYCIVDLKTRQVVAYRHAKSARRIEKNLGSKYMDTHSVRLCPKKLRKGD